MLYDVCFSATDGEPGVRKQAIVIGFEEAYPLWALSTPDVGGLGWGTIEIGKVRTIDCGLALCYLREDIAIKAKYGHVLIVKVGEHACLCVYRRS